MASSRDLGAAAPAPSCHHRSLSDKAAGLITAYTADNVAWARDPDGAIGRLNKSHEALSEYVAWLERENRLYAEQAEYHQRESHDDFLKLTAAEERIARLEAASSAHYRPIADLTDGTKGSIVLWNSCNGPMLEMLVLPEDAAGWREDGVFTHFVLLEDDPEAA